MRAVTRAALPAIWCLFLTVHYVNSLKIASIPQTCGQNLQRILEQPNQVRAYEAIKNHSSDFQDQLFPADKASLFWQQHHGKDSRLITVYREKIVGWLRPSEVIHRYQKVNTSLPSLWGHKGIQAIDIGGQGELNDGWFLGAVASIAEHPKYLMKLFKQQEYNTSGVFEIKLFINGEHRLVLVNDLLAMLKDDIPVNARPSMQGGWWLPLLEKAYAKVNVNYENLDYGRSLTQVEALRALTGMPVKQLNMKKAGAIQELKQDYMDSYALSIYVPRAKGKQGPHPLGLRRGRSYNVVDLIEVSLPGSIETKIVAIALRDPWTRGGKISYTGPRFEKYGQKPESEVNKTFFIETHVFLKTFQEVNVAMLSDSWIVTSKDVKKSTDDLYRMVFTNPQAQDAYVTIDYPTQRMYAKGCPRADVIYNVTVLAVGNRKVVGKTIVNTKISYGIVELPQLDKGNYEIMVTMAGKLNQATGFKTTLYTLKKKLVFKDDYWVLSQNLRDAIQRKDPKLYLRKVEDGQVQINAFYDQDQRQQTVEIVKNKTNDYAITIQVQTYNGFPHKTESNTDWKNGLIAQKGSITQADSVVKYEQMKVECTKKYMRCIYVIPQAKKLVDVLVE